MTVRQEELSIAVLAGGDVDLVVRGARYTAVSGEVLRVPLPDQGPVLTGRPQVSQFAQARRDDGSLLTASIPIIPDWEADANDAQA